MARKVGVSREQVVDAAVVIADRDGFSAVTLTTVAAAVGVQPPSLYAHVKGLEGLRRALQLRAYEMLHESLEPAVREQADNPRQALRTIGYVGRAFARAHPGLYACLTSDPSTDPDAEGVVGEPMRLTSSVLAQLGVPAGRRLHLVRAFMAQLRGFLDLELADAFGTEGVDESFESMLDLFIDAIEPPPAGQ